MPPQNLFPAQWMHATKEVREYLAAMWKLSRSGVTEIRDQDVLSDGYTLEDLRAITLERMNEYLGEEHSFARAWELTQIKAYEEMHPEVVTMKPTEEVRVIADEVVEVKEEVVTEETTADVVASEATEKVANVFDIPHGKKSE